MLLHGRYGKRHGFIGRKKDSSPLRQKGDAFVFQTNLFIPCPADQWQCFNWYDEEELVRPTKTTYNLIRDNVASFNLPSFLSSRRTLGFTGKAFAHWYGKVSFNLSMRYRSGEPWAVIVIYSKRGSTPYNWNNNLLDSDRVGKFRETRSAGFLGYLTTLGETTLATCQK